MNLNFLKLQKLLFDLKQDNNFVSFNMNSLFFVFLIYLISYAYSLLAGQQHFLIAGEHLTTNSSEIVLRNMLGADGLERTDFLTHSEFPRGIHGSIFHNFILYSWVYVGQIIGLNSTATQLFFGGVFQFYGLFLILTHFKKNPPFYVFFIPFLVWFLNYQNFEVLLSAGLFWIAHGLMLIAIGCLLRISAEQNCANFYYLLLAFVLCISVYSAFSIFHVFLVIAIYFTYQFLKRKRLDWKLFCVVLVPVLTVSPFAAAVWVDPQPYQNFAFKQEVLFALTSGFVKIQESRHFVFYALGIMFSIYVFYLLKKYTNNKIILSYLFFVVWQISDFGSFILNKIPMFQMFRSTHRLTVLTLIMIVVALYLSYWKSQRFFKISGILIISFQIFYISYQYPGRFSLTSIPENYLNAQKYLNEIEATKMHLPISFRHQFASDTYGWFGINKNTPYGSNVFALHLPIKGFLDIDEVENASEYRLKALKFVLKNSQTEFLEFLREYKVGYLIVDREKKGDGFDLLVSPPVLTKEVSFGAIDIYKVNLEQEASYIDLSKSFRINRVSQPTVESRFFKANHNLIGLNNFVQDLDMIRHFLKSDIVPAGFFQLRYPMNKQQRICLRLVEGMDAVNFFSLESLNDFDFEIEARETPVFHGRQSDIHFAKVVVSSNLDEICFRRPDRSIFFSLETSGK